MAPAPGSRAAAWLTENFSEFSSPGGSIVMGNWTKEGFIGEMFQTFARFIAPPGMPAPTLWGDEDTVRVRFGSGVSRLQLTRVDYRFDYPLGPEEVVEFFRQYYGPTTQAFAKLGEGDSGKLRSELVELWSSHNRAKTKGRTQVDAEYLQVLATRV